VLHSAPIVALLNAAAPAPASSTAPPYIYIIPSTAPTRAQPTSLFQAPFSSPPAALTQWHTVAPAPAPPSVSLTAPASVSLTAPVTARLSAKSLTGPQNAFLLYIVEAMELRSAGGLL
jgi:hypothetical protein